MSIFKLLETQRTRADFQLASSEKQLKNLKEELSQKNESIKKMRDLLGNEVGIAQCVELSFFSALYTNK